MAEANAIADAVVRRYGKRAEQVAQDSAWSSSEPQANEDAGAGK